MRMCYNIVTTKTAPQRGGKRYTMKTNYTIEIQRHNITPAQFLAYVRRRLKATGGDAFCGCLDLDYFAAGSEPNYDTERDGTHCISRSKPYDMQTYIREDGRLYNEICEFEFDDEKTGHGYYYLIDAETDETTETTPAAAPETEAETESAERAAEIADAAAIDMVRSIISARCSRSAWGRGVLKYAAELLEWLAADQCARRAIGMPVTPFAEVTAHDLNVRLRNGARDWHEYSYGGCALIYDGDIAARLCTASELRRTHNGQRDPNPRETWLDVQARALTSAAAIACDAVVKGVRA